MANAKRVLRCMKCGAILQTENKKKIGYILPDAISELTPTSIVYCQNCFEKIKTLNQGSLDAAVDRELLKILDDAVATDALIIWVVDLFSSSGVLNSDVVKKVKNLKIVVIGTKRDLFSRFTDENLFITSLKTTFNQYKIKPTKIFTIGGYEKEKISNITKEVNKIRAGHDVYVLGNLSSGKTTLINNFLKFYKNKSTSSINTMTYPGTNVRVLEIPFTNSSFLYGLPDLSSSTSLLSKVEKDVQKVIFPLKDIRCDIKTLSAGDGTSFGSLAAIVLHKGKTTMMRFYVAPGVETKKFKEEKTALILNQASLGEHYAKPISKNFINFLDFDIFEYKMENDNKYRDIAIEGLGWVTFKSKGQLIRVIIPKGTVINSRISRIKK